MSESFRDVQRQFSAYMRDPENTMPPENIEERRLKVYRELFYNTVEGLLAKSFPVIREILDDRDQWHVLVRDFYTNARCDSPYFTELPERFVVYLADEVALPLPPYLPELAHYEWLELVLEIAEDTKLVPPATQGDLLDDVPVLNPVYQLAQYHWPVSQIAVNCEPDAPLSTPMLVLLYRDAGDVVRFMEINGITAAFVEQLNSMPELSGREHLQRLATQLPQIPVEQVLHFGADMLTDFQARGLILGTMQRP